MKFWLTARSHNAPAGESANADAFALAATCPRSLSE
jgi:hypothetical protein